MIDEKKTSVNLKLNNKLSLIPYITKLNHII